MRIQKRLAGQILNASPKRIRFDNARLADIKEAITKTDIRKLIDERAIIKINEKGISKGRTRKNKLQKSKGKRKGRGSKEGSETARLPSKKAWINKIRSQRDLISSLRDTKTITNDTYKLLYKKTKGGYFRSRRHIKIFLEDNKLTLRKQEQPNTQKTKQEPEKKKQQPKKPKKKAPENEKSEQQ